MVGRRLGGAKGNITSVECPFFHFVAHTCCYNHLCENSYLVVCLGLDSKHCRDECCVLFCFFCFFLRGWMQQA